MTFDPLFPVAVIVLLLVVPAVLFAISLVRARGAARWAPARRLGVVALLAVAAAGPAIPGSGTVTELRSNVDVFVLMDTTTSSNAEDYGNGVTRLDLMKKDVEGLQAKYGGARFGLITFDSAAVVRLPLVNDAEALDSVLDGLTVEVTEDSRGSSPYIAADLAERQLRADKAANPSHVRVLVYMSDGEITAQDPGPDDFGELKGLFDAGEVLGYGTAKGGPMRQHDFVDYQGAFEGDGVTPTPVPTPTQEPYLIDPSTGQEAISHLDESTLKSIASALGVAYHHRDPATAVPAPDVDQKLGERVSVKDASIAYRLYWIPVIPAFLLLAWDVAATVRRGVALTEFGRREDE